MENRQLPQFRVPVLLCPLSGITENLLRKRAEHNDLEIFSLEEVSLHQQEIEKIEHIDKLCRELKILYLQSNLIPKIENVSKLKKLEYINLALNNIEIIENLEGCESLKKLDLTVNFVGELTSIESLKDLYHLKEIFLTGNPCTDYDGYREYVIATLPQLKHLDGIEIEKSERIQAIQNLPKLRVKILEQQEEHKRKREREKEDARLEEEQEKEKEERQKQKKAGFDGRWYTDINESDKKKPDSIVTSEDCDENEENDKEEIEKKKEEKEKQFWEEKTSYTPESRLKVHKHMADARKRDEKKEEGTTKKERKMFAEDGRPLNVNDAKVGFSLTEDDSNVILDVAIYKFLDTSNVDVDVQTNYVRVQLKGKTLQLCLDEEVKPDSSSAKRSQITGHLVITMPKVNPVLQPTRKKEESKIHQKKNEVKDRNRVEKLEVDESAKKSVDIANIVKEKPDKIVPPLGHRTFGKPNQERPNSDDFVDDPDVPPLC